HLNHPHITYTPLFRSEAIFLRAHKPPTHWVPITTTSAAWCRITWVRSCVVQIPSFAAMGTSTRARTFPKACQSSAVTGCSTKSRSEEHTSELQSRGHL